MRVRNARAPSDAVIRNSGTEARAQRTTSAEIDVYGTQ
jgi:hypothetical protein